MQRHKIIQALSGNVIEVAVGFTTIMFITRNYPQDQAGIYFLIMGMVAVLNNLKEGFLQNGFVKYYVESCQDLGILNAGLLMTWAWDLINVLLFAALTLFNDQFAPFLVYYILQILGFSCYRWTLFVHKSDLNLAVIFQVNVLVLTVTACGLLCLYFWQLPIFYCLAVSGMAYGFATITFPENRRLLLKAMCTVPDISKVKRLMRFGKHGLLKELAGTISHQSGVFLSAFFLSLDATALLGLANRYAVLIAIPGSSLSGLIYPALLKIGVDPGKLKSAASEGIGKMYALLIPLALTICAAAPFLIMGLHGMSYGFAAVILIIRVLLTTFLLPMGTGFSSIMNVMNHPEKITQLVWITSLVNLTFTVVLMPLIGIWGAIISPVITEVVGFVLMRRGLKTIRLEIVDITQQVVWFWNHWRRKGITGFYRT